MWHHLAVFIVRFRIFLLVILLSVTAFMAYHASKVELSYEFTQAIPTDNSKYVEYQDFRKQFGEDGNMMAIGVRTDRFFETAFFNDYATLAQQIAKVSAVENVLSVPGAINLVKDTATSRLQVVRLLPSLPIANTDSLKNTFNNLPFYKGMLYNADSGSYLMAVRINKQILNSANRNIVIGDILELCEAFGKKHNITVHYSGLPHIRTAMATRVQAEMKMFLIMSFLFTAVILALFFRSAIAVLVSMLVVAMGVIWSTGTIALLGYKITLLTALIPPLIVVIGIPNCVYFLNKYHTEYHKKGDKRKALLCMVERMGIVTLFTNLTAAIGFGVFYFTNSALLKEFGLVAGLNIAAIFFISLIFIPAVFSFLPAPNVRHTSYLESGWIMRLLDAITKWVFSHRAWIYAFTVVVCVVAVLGILRLKNDTYIVDDLPKGDKVYQDLKFFERNFKGVMPLEIEVDTRKKRGVMSLEVLGKIDELNTYLQQYPEIGKPLAITEGIKFARQAYYDGDTASYGVPNTFDAAFILPYLSMKGNNNDKNSAMFNKLLNSFIDSNKQKARISVNMADVGSVRLPVLLDSICPKVNELFDSSRYTVTFTGTSVVFLEGSKFIIHSLRDSLLLAFLMIFGCMILLFRSWRILLMSIIVNVVPLMITAGVMGWMGVRIKPSTVLVFSVALGITIDVTIRFLVNFKQEQARHDNGIADIVRRTIHDTGLSIIYTSLILIAGFGVFIFSKFDGTKSLGYLTSLTLFLAMVTNLTLLPAFLLWMGKVKVKKDKLIDMLAEGDLEDKN